MQLVLKTGAVTGVFIYSGWPNSAPTQVDVMLKKKNKKQCTISACANKKDPGV